MSAMVCGKRSSSLFEELQFTPPPAKRSRCSTAAAASPDALRAEREFLIERLRSQFPDAADESVEKALEDSGFDLNLATNTLTVLRSEGVDGSSSAFESEVKLTSPDDNRATAPVENGHSMENLPADGAQWVDLLVKEMASAASMDDARARASRVLEVLEKSVVSRAGVETTQNFEKETTAFKGQLEAVLRENAILKRAVAIQHERQKEYDQKTEELQQVKQLVAQYQEQVRTLEMNNYALTMHLRQAQQSSSIPGRFHPDVF